MNLAQAEVRLSFFLHQQYKLFSGTYLPLLTCKLQGGVDTSNSHTLGKTKEAAECRSSSPPPDLALG